MSGWIVVPFLILFAWLAIRAHRARPLRVQRVFDALTFNTPDGPRSGAQMRVVKRIVDTFGGQQGGGGINSAYWYCVGPGPSYFVAIAQQVQVGLATYRLEWVIRPLSATRMRGALAGDIEALIATFGDVVDDRLHA